MPGKRRARRGFGKIRKLPSGRYQASYIGPDLLRHTAIRTFEAREDAEGWLNKERRLTDDPDAWTSPRVREARRQSGMTLRAFAPDATQRRKVRGRSLTPRTLAHYDRLLEKVLYPTFGDTIMSRITPEQISAWYDALPAEHPTQRAHAYSLLSSLLQQDIDEEADRTNKPVVRVNPCRIKGAGVAERVREIKPATVEQLATITENMPDELQAMVILSAWCGLRFGEVAALRRRDIDTTAGTVRVERAVVHLDGQNIIGAPKSAAGVRTIALPPHIVPMLQDHLRKHTGKGRDALLFPCVPGSDEPWTNGGPFARVFAVARDAADRDDLRFHDLRHTGAVLAAQSGATLKELMQRLGHSTPTMALRYQHVAEGRDAAIARAMSERATQTTTGS